MILLIDAGNTRIKAGFLLAGQPTRSAHIVTVLHDQVHLLPDRLCNLWQELQVNTPVSDALGVSVASEALENAIDEQLSNRLGVRMRWLNGATPAEGMTNNYHNPARLGADRWLAMVGIAELANNDPVILATFGTATTVDALAKQDGKQCFLGGLILPGPDLMRNSLASGTARLPHANNTLAAFPRHTHQAISTGIAAAQAGAVCRQFSELHRLTGQVPRVLCSGGGWPTVETEIQSMLDKKQSELGLPRCPAQWVEAPVLDGLTRIALGGQQK